MNGHNFHLIQLKISENGSESALAKMQLVPRSRPAWMSTKLTPVQIVRVTASESVWHLKLLGIDSLKSRSNI